MRITYKSVESTVEAKLREFGQGRNIKKSTRNSVTENDGFKFLLTLQESHQTAITEVASNINLSRSTEVRKKVKLHPYKLCLLQDLSEGD